MKNKTGMLEYIDSMSITATGWLLMSGALVCQVGTWIMIIQNKTSLLECLGEQALFGVMFISGFFLSKQKERQKIWNQH